MTEQDTESSKLLNWDNLVNSYDIHSRWVVYDFHVPKALRSSLPIPGGYDNCKWLYSFIPFPGRESKNFVIHRLEGHISTLLYTSLHSELTNPPFSSSIRILRMGQPSASQLSGRYQGVHGDAEMRRASSSMAFRHVGSLIERKG